MGCGVNKCRRALDVQVPDAPAAQRVAPAEDAAISRWFFQGPGEQEPWEQCVHDPTQSQGNRVHRVRASFPQLYTRSGRERAGAELPKLPGAKLQPGLLLGAPGRLCDPRGKHTALILTACFIHVRYKHPRQGCAFTRDAKGLGSTREHRAPKP